MSKACSTLRDANQASCLPRAPRHSRTTVSSSLIRHRRVVDLDPATGRIRRLSQRLDTTYAALVDGHIDELNGWITEWAPSTSTQEVKARAAHGIYSQVGRSTTKSDGASRPCRIRC
jgi:hypothetical protein